MSQTIEFSAPDAEVLELVEAAPEEAVPAEHVAPPEPLIVPMGPLYDVIATHYGVAYNGRTLGCGTGYYSSENVMILAVGPSRASEWPCGTLLQICGPLACNLVIRHDSCPGCGRNVIDLSEGGIDYVCGYQTSTCRVSIQKVKLVDPPREEPPHSEEPAHHVEQEAEAH